MKNIILIDTAFPYEKVEPFLETEIKYYSSDTNVYIANCLLKDTSSIRDCNNAKVLDIPPVGSRLNRLINKFFYGIKALFVKELWMEIVLLGKEGRLNISRLKSLLIFAADAERCVSNIKGQLPRNINGEDTLFYSYWMHIHAYTAARLKKMYKGSKFVTRCHRYDIYEEDNGVQYIPFRNYILSSADKVFCICQDGYDYLKGKYPGIENKLKISRLGTLDRGEGVALTRDELVIISCSWMQKVKRVHLIAEALSKITDIPVKWIHFGNGVLFDEIKEYAKCLPPNIKTEFPGAVSNAQVHKYYKNNGGHIFINVSESEGVPVSIMEAMSYGIPVIATDVGGVREVMAEGDRWLLAKDFDTDELVSKIRCIYNMTDSEYALFRETIRNTWKEMSYADRHYKEFVADITNI